MGLANRGKGALFLVYVLGSLFFNWTFLVPLAALLSCIAYVPNTTRVYLDEYLGYVVSFWMASIIGFVELVMGTTFIMYGDDVEAAGVKGERAIVMCNHPTRTDWLFLVAWAVRFGRLNKLKIVLKDSLARAPWAGWTIQAAMFLFLSRDWARDERKLSSLVSYWRELSGNVQVLLFPEGTNLTDYTKSLAREHCVANNLPVWDYVLPPRTKGMLEIMRIFRGDVSSSGASPSSSSSSSSSSTSGTVVTGRDMGIDAIYDLTLAYSPHPVEDETSLFKDGDFPKFVHIHLARFPINKLPVNDQDAMKNWIQTRFAEKEEMLSKFYTTPGIESDLVPPLLSSSLLPPSRRHRMLTGLALLLTLFIIGLVFLRLVAPGYRMIKLLYVLLVNVPVLYLLTIRQGRIDDAILRASGFGKTLASKEKLHAN